MCVHDGTELLLVLLAIIWRRKESARWVPRRKRRGEVVGSTWRGGGVGACAVRGCCRARASEARGREAGDGRMIPMPQSRIQIEDM
jgi:hypothetical protein